MKTIFTILSFLFVTGVCAQANTECVELLEDWAGNSAGEQVMVAPQAAQNLVESGRGVYCTLAIEFVEVEDQEIPTVYELSNAYPNPFNPSTSFTLTLASAQSVNVQVFNLLGQMVEAIDLGTLDAEKTYQVRFSADHLTSGTYVVRFMGENFTSARTVVLMK